MISSRADMGALAATISVTAVSLIFGISLAHGLPVQGSSRDVIPNVDKRLTDASVSHHRPQGASTETIFGNGFESDRVVGWSGVGAWNALPMTERDQIRLHKSFFLHQSVGGDLEDGAEFNGFAFEYVDSSSVNLSPGLNGGLFSSNNGNPLGKISEFRSLALANQADLRVAIMKFGYADVATLDLSEIQSAYRSAVADLKSAGVRVVHITPPLTYDESTQNAIRLQMRTWMLATFPEDVVFDLADLESTQPATLQRCMRGGAWEICDSVRSTIACPSLHQGIDNPSGQGHICYNPHAMSISKALLFAIYLASRP